MDQTAIIIGAGQAGGEAAIRLRQQGHVGRIVLVGAESQLPYARPPLSKSYLSGEVATDTLPIRLPAAFEKAGIELRLQAHADGIDRHERTVTLQGGEALGYDVLILATGGHARPLQVPGHALRHIFTLRTIDDVDAIRAQFLPGRRLAIVGGGYVGLEVAAVAVSAGLAVTVLEGAPRVLARVTGPEMSSFYERLHRSRGVDIRTGVAVSGFVAGAADPACVGGVACGEDAPVAADLVLVGIGLVANTGLAEAAGLIVDGGILVGPDGRTADPRIFAIGDCATHAEHGFLGRRLRLESVPNAIEQAHACAAAICGKPSPKATPPWFWSDQYGLKLQMVGLSSGHDRVVLRGTPDSASFVAFYLNEGTVIAAEAVDRPGDFMAARRMVAERMTIPPASLADDTVSLKTLLVAPRQ